MSDILKDPDAVLNLALHTSDARQGLVEFGRLHRHMLAGGRPPGLWTADGTAVGKVIAELQANAYIFHINSCSSACNVAETDWGALKTDAEVALRAVTGKG